MYPETETRGTISVNEAERASKPLVRNGQEDTGQGGNGNFFCEWRRNGDLTDSTKKKKAARQKLT
jgi:hypothetical protein